MPWHVKNKICLFEIPSAKVAHLLPAMSGSCNELAFNLHPKHAVILDVLIPLTEVSAPPLPELNNTEQKTSCFRKTGINLYKFMNIVWGEITRNVYLDLSHLVNSWAIAIKEQAVTKITRRYLLPNSNDCYQTSSRVPSNRQHLNTWWSEHHRLNLWNKLNEVTIQHLVVNLKNGC